MHCDLEIGQLRTSPEYNFDTNVAKCLQISAERKSCWGDWSYPSRLKNITNERDLVRVGRESIKVDRRKDNNE